MFALFSNNLLHIHTDPNQRAALSHHGLTLFRFDQIYQV